MTIDPPKDEGLEFLLQEIAKNIDENHRFIKGLKEDRMDQDLEDDEPVSEDEEFEEL
jgi:hypothetical protein